MPSSPRTAVLAGIAFVVAASAFVLASIRVAHTNERVEHTIRVKLAIAQLRTDVILADKGTEDYLISGDPERRAIFTDAAASFRDDVAQVRELTSDNPKQLELLQGVDARITPQLATLSEIVATRDREGRDAAVLAFEKYLGSQGFENRAAVMALNAEEDRLFAEREIAGQNASVAALVAASLASVSFAFLLVFAWTDRRAREQAKQTVEARRLQLEAENRTLYERAQITDFQEQFIAILGHDLRNPLGAISMGIDLLRHESKGEEKTLQRMSSSAQRMARMIDQLLDLTRSRLAGGIALTRSPMDLGKLTNDVVDELRTQRPDGVFKVASSGDLHGNWDADRLAQVISNLVGNAIHHGGVDSPVVVAVDGSDKDVCFSVKNGGKPIDAELQRILFEPFRRGDRQGNSNKTAGVGLGLFISKEIVTRHGGTIAVTSSEGLGTELRFVLPREAEPRT